MTDTAILGYSQWQRANAVTCSDARGWLLPSTIACHQKVDAGDTMDILVLKDHAAAKQAYYVVKSQGRSKCRRPVSPPRGSAPIEDQ